MDWAQLCCGRGCTLLTLARNVITHLRNRRLRGRTVLLPVVGAPSDPPRAHRPPPADTVREHLHAGQPSSPCTGLWSVSSSELSTLTELCWFCVASHLFSTKHCVVGMLLWVYPAKALALQLPFYQELHTVASRVSTETGQMMYSWCLRIEKSFPGEELWFS